jgi:hypothetical protein
MKTRALLLALLLVTAAPASPAGAMDRIALMVHGYSGGGAGANPTDADYAQWFHLLRQVGTPCDLYNVGNRTWGSAGKADSTWFRERYAAVVVLWFPRSNSTAMAWFTNFADEAGAFNDWDHSPVNGKWSVPVYVYARNGVLPNGVTGNNLVTGTTVSSPAGSFAKPAVAEAGTWRYRNLSRLRGTAVPDTSWLDGFHFACKATSWGGLGSTVALVWADSAIATCAAGDTAVMVWRYRPLAGKPGVTWSMLQGVKGAGVGGNAQGQMVLLASMYRDTGIRPLRKIQVPLMEHHPGAGRADATGAALVDSVWTAYRSVGLPMWGALESTPCEWEAVSGVAALAPVRSLLRGRANRGEFRWSPHTHDGDCPVGSGVNWQWDYYLATDSTGFRIRYNRQVETATAADSLALPRASYDPRRVVPPNDEVGVWLGNTLADAGVRIVETVAPSGGSSTDRWYHALWQEPAPRWLRGADETRLLWTQHSEQIPHGGTFTATKGTRADHEYIGSGLLPILEMGASGYSGVYWHTDGVTGQGTTNDPWWAWVWRGPVAGWFATFAPFVEADPFAGGMLMRPRSTFTTRTTFTTRQ